MFDVLLMTSHPCSLSLCDYQLVLDRYIRNLSYVSDVSNCISLPGIGFIIKGFNLTLTQIHAMLVGVCFRSVYSVFITCLKGIVQVKILKYVERHSYQLYAMFYTQHWYYALPFIK